MSRLSKFFNQPQEITIGDEKFLITPLKAKHLHLFMKENMTDEEKANVGKDLIKQSLSPTEPDITDEEISNLPIKIFNNLLEEIMKVNGLGGQDERIRKIKEKIIQART